MTDDKAARFRGLAAKLRLESAGTSDAAACQVLEELARQYEALADWLERRTQTSG